METVYQDTGVENAGEFLWSMNKKTGIDCVMAQEKKEQVIEVKLGPGLREIGDLQTLLKKCIDQGFPLVAISRATKLPEAELQEYLNGSLPSDFSRTEYLHVFLILLLHEKPVSDTYYRDLMDGLIRVFEIPEETIARYADVSADELNGFEKSDKREHIERCIAHLFVTFMRDSRFTCENGLWVTKGCGESEQKEENQ